MFLGYKDICILMETNLSFIAGRQNLWSRIYLCEDTKYEQKGKKNYHFSVSHLFCIFFSFSSFFFIFFISKKRIKSYLLECVQKPKQADEENLIPVPALSLFWNKKLSLNSGTYILHFYCLKQKTFTNLWVEFKSCWAANVLTISASVEQKNLTIWWMALWEGSETFFVCFEWAVIPELLKGKTEGGHLCSRFKGRPPPRGWPSGWWLTQKLFVNNFLSILTFLFLWILHFYLLFLYFSFSFLLKESHIYPWWDFFSGRSPLLEARSQTFFGHHLLSKKKWWKSQKS